MLFTNGELHAFLTIIMLSLFKIKIAKKHTFYTPEYTIIFFYFNDSPFVYVKCMWVSLILVIIYRYWEILSRRRTRRSVTRKCPVPRNPNSSSGKYKGHGGRDRENDSEEFVFEQSGLKDVEYSAMKMYVFPRNLTYNQARGSTGLGIYWRIGVWK